MERNTRDEKGCQWGIGKERGRGKERERKEMRINGKGEGVKRGMGTRGEIRREMLGRAEGGTIRTV